MFTKSFTIERSKDKTVLTLNNHHLSMSPKKKNNHLVYFSTTDMRTGIIHNKKSVFDRVILKKYALSFYSFYSCTLKHYYYSTPIYPPQTHALFYPQKHEHKQRKRFELKEIQNLKLTTYEYQRFNQRFAKDSLNLFWWRSDNFINIGDELNLYLVAYLSKKHIRKTSIKHTNLLGIGSILDWAKPRNKIYPVWGSGTLAPQPLDNHLYKVTLLRGPLTHASFNNPDFKAPYGDPALICNRIWKRPIEKKYDWGLIIHHSHYQKAWAQKLLQNTPNTLFIDITNPNIDEFFQQLMACKAIASSSLHGLVLADSYAIPNIWLWDNNLHEGGKWKFFDYFAGIHRTEINPIDPNRLYRLNDIATDPMNLSYFDKLEKIKDTIIDNFPL